VLASDEDGGLLDALKLSLASDIVELAVLTTDPVFLRTLREAVGGARRLWNVASADKVSDLLVAGQVGIAVLDLQALNEASVFIGQIKRQFPDLVVVCAGNRDDESSLAGLISAGIVYRFIHKPMSPGRAKLFAEAAIKKHDEQRRRAAESPPHDRAQGSIRPWLIGGAIGVAGLIAATWLMQSSVRDDAGPAQTAVNDATAGSSLLLRAGAALAANRLTEPNGDNALELYRQALARNPADMNARDGLQEVHERLLARAENALLEERLNEAAAAIETARKSGVEGARIAFLTAQLAKSREQVRTAQPRTQTPTRVRDEPKADVDPAAPLLDLAAQSLSEGRLLAPDRDNARFYVLEALRLAPDSVAGQESRRLLAWRLLNDARSAVDRRDFALAASLIEGAGGFALPADIESAQGLLAGARRQADVDARVQLLKNANDRLQQDWLIEPENDSAKYFLLNLRQLDPGNPGLAAAMQDLGSRLVAKARRALSLEQYDAARSWLDEAAAIGFASGDASSAQHDLDAAVAKQKFLANLIPAGQLTLLKRVEPVYPNKAAMSRKEGWVELEFTVSETGQVQDVLVHAASIPGMFDDAAVKALSQWRFQPVLRDLRPVPVRAVLRVRFLLS